MGEALQFAFMRNALLAGVLVSIACGIIGTFVVVKRIVFISGGIAHAAYGGIGLGYYFRYMLLPGLVAAGSTLDPRPGYWPLLGAILFSLGAAAVMGVIQRRTDQRADTIIGVLWALGMATGIIFVDLTAGYKVDLMSYLFGSILAVEQRELWAMLVLDLVILGGVALLYKELLAVSFDETFATVTNVPVDTVYVVLLGMIALTVVMMMRVVGLIMVIAMLTMPAAIAGHYVRDMKRMMAWAVGLGIAFTTVGLWVSYAWNLTSGASIIVVSGVGYLVSLALRGVRRGNGLRATG
ncbi:MAG: metal ABC transporter permease [Anaerolineae bacterium]|nr:metal ABC transporter permease [Anaerolineae bacterium]